ncbi:oxaloacetate decarboxylase subunit alpha [Candidatus Bathyarchaeota archaeon]|nr:MAG: oxaloacetate decarboxylase subunit alpha [Candidatus Bathyarchaeota archaeon]HDD69607.1 oxaloacetate decarboxylase subunit alpha [Candidatus Bathyarchaeota archaeon]
MTPKPVKITDTTFRDAHQSLMATRMRTDAMLPIAEKIDQVGFFSIEMWGGATFDVCIRYLAEDPWERIRVLKRHIKNTPFQMLLRGQNVVGYRNYPDDVVIKFVEKAAENGIDIFRVFDALNDVRNMEVAIKTIKKCGKHAQGSICYTISPVHTIEYYVDVAKKLAELECDSICIKDMAGMLAPKPAYELITTLKKEVGLPVHLHSHSTSGMVMMTYLRACDAGVDILDTAFSPLAWGTSQPPVESVVAALKGTPYDTGLNLELLHEIAEYFQELREKYYDPLKLINPKSERVDPSILIHQIPGGMFSNLLEQLKEQNALHRLKDVLEEVPIVRKELGYPPLVTPTSQLVGIQAVFNVLSGKRYSIVPKEVKDYVKGFYGKPPAPIDEKVKKLIIGDEEPITCRPADLLEPALNKIPEEVKPYIESEEDKLTHALFPQVALEFFKKRKAKREEAKTGIPPEKIAELEEAAAVSVAIAAYLASSRGIKALIPVRAKGTVSPWVLAGRQSLTE